MKASLTVFFEDPFWVGVFERIEDGKLSVCKVTFGAEPKDYDVLDFVLHQTEPAGEKQRTVSTMPARTTSSGSRPFVCRTL